MTCWAATYWYILPGDSRPARHQRAQFRLAHHGEQHQVPGQQAGRGFDDVGRGRSLRQVGEPDHQASPPLARQQGIRGQGVIGLDRLTRDQGQLFQDVAKMLGAARAGQIGLQLPPISQKPRGITRMMRHVRQSQRRVDGVIKFHERAGEWADGQVGRWHLLTPDS